MAALKLWSWVLKWMRHTIATTFLPRSYCQTYSGYPRVGFCLSTGRCTDASSTWHRRFPGAKGARLHFSNTMATEFIGSKPSWVDYSIWSVLQKKVYRSTIANINEFDMRLINERGALSSRSWMLLSSAVAPSSQRLCPWSVAHFERFFLRNCTI